MKTKGVIESPPKKATRARRTANDLYKQFLSSQCDEEDSDSDSEDEDDKSFESPHGNSFLPFSQKKKHFLLFVFK